MAFPLPAGHILKPPHALPATPRHNVARAVLDSVKHLVNPLVPCVPGGNDMPLLEAAQAAGYSLLLTRSEAGAGQLSNGIAWESDMTTLCIVITSVGVYGLIQALYAAFVNERPLVVISGEVGGLGRGCVQAGDGWDGPSVTQVTRPLTVWSVDAHTASEACRAVPRAVALAATSRRPVHINIPLSVQKDFP